MRKHNLFTIVFILLAVAGAGLFYYSNMQLLGQILFFAATTGIVTQTKFNGSIFQNITAVAISLTLGGISGDWFLAPATLLGCLALNLRSFVFTKAIYTKALLTETILGSIALAIYFSVNFLHHNSWQAWTFSAPGIVIGFLVSIVNYKDRVQVRKMLELGVITPGTPAPDFSLINYDGKKISMSDYKGKRDVLLIFVRGDWCPGCHIMLRLYERERKKFQDKNIMLFAIGPDPVGVNKAMVEKLGVEFAVLSDENMEVSKKFCVQIQENGGDGKFEFGIPLPASFLVDKKGIVRYTSRADNAGEFLSPNIIFDVLAKI